MMAPTRSAHAPHVPLEAVGRGVPALTVADLAAGYPGLRTAVQGVSFTVQAGEQIGVIGPNGAGKSTLFKAIAGIIPHHGGCISIHGEDCAHSHNMVGYVPQHEDIDWRFPVTVRDVVMMGRTRQIGWLRWPGRRDWRAVDRVLDRAGMLPFRDRQIGQLSGGQKRRVFIARALAQETDVLLLDEPFNGVDANAEQEIMSTLRVLRDDGVTILLATHNLGLAARAFDRILLLQGTVVAYGDRAQVFRPEVLGRVYGQQIGIFQEDGQMIFIGDEHGCQEEHDHA